MKVNPLLAIYKKNTKDNYLIISSLQRQLSPIIFQALKSIFLPKLYESESS